MSRLFLQSERKSPLFRGDFLYHRWCLTISGFSRALSRIRLRTEVYPLPRDFARLRACGESRNVTVCLQRSSLLVAEILR